LSQGRCTVGKIGQGGVHHAEPESPAADEDWGKCRHRVSRHNSWQYTGRPRRTRAPSGSEESGHQKL